MSRRYPSAPMLRLPRLAFTQMIGLAYDSLPFEACGLVGGDPSTAEVDRFYPCHNEAESSKLYTVAGKDMLLADRDAEDRGFQLIGVMHSHTHTDPYPSPTDISQAVDPSWHYLIVSLKYDAPVLRSYLIAVGTITEEEIEIIE